MRELSDCHAEVFRRSEQRIKEHRRRRKRILMTCIPLVLCIAIAGAVLLPASPTADMTVPENAQEPGAAAPMTGNSGAGTVGMVDGSDQVQYVCINVTRREEFSAHRVVLLRSRQELEAYLETAETNQKPGNLLAKYDEQFFEENCLVYIPLGQGSSSVRHRVTGCKTTADGKLAIYIQREVPESATCDLVHWEMLVEARNDSVPGDRVQIYLNGSLFLDENAAVWPCEEGLE